MSSTQRRALDLKPLYHYDKPTLERPYLIRADLKWATQDWIVPATARGDFEIALSQAFNEVWGHHPFFISADYQRARLAELPIPHVSFDRVTGSQHWVSRVFNPCTHQHKPVAWMSSDLSSIPPGEYALVDDDIASGATVEYIKSQTPQVKWTESFGMAQWSLKSGCFDIVDARDFLFGAKQAGLCVKQGDSVYRVPYITPWVNLMQRAKIPPHKQAAFVADIIEANIRFFFRVPVKVGETDNPLFWQALGYSLDTSMYEVSRDLFAWNPNT